MSQNLRDNISQNFKESIKPSNLRNLTAEELLATDRGFEFFWNGTFSQWKFSRFIENGVVFTSAEQYMMYHKAMLFGDRLIANQILTISYPKEIKALGRKVRNFDEKIWDESKYEIVKKGNILKFSQNRNLRDELLSTGNRILVEASPFDNIWGIKMGVNDPRINNPKNWRGQNLLGFALTEVREILREG